MIPTDDIRIKPDIYIDRHKIFSIAGKSSAVYDACLGAYMALALLYQDHPL
ncbi:MAG: hypothetical protein ABI045_03275 [Flavobacteriales bacterium]